MSSGLGTGYWPSAQLVVFPPDDPGLLLLPLPFCPSVIILYLSVFDDLSSAYFSAMIAPRDCAPGLSP